MTKKKIMARAKIKKELQSKGVLPPDKKRLNRRKFIDEAKKEWSERDKNCYVWHAHIMMALSWMISYTDNNLRPSQQAVGAAKVLKIALKIKEFEENVKNSGSTTYRLNDLHEAIKDIMEA